MSETKSIMDMDPCESELCSMELSADLAGVLSSKHYQNAWEYSGMIRGYMAAMLFHGICTPNEFEVLANEFAEMAHNRCMMSEQYTLDLDLITAPKIVPSCAKVN